MTIHRNLTGADLHEPKGIETALAGQIYVSDGAGSGSWVAASTVITNTAFSTGDLKPTLKANPDTGWLLWVDGTIGDGSSGGTVRANADTQALFILLWNGLSDLLAPVSGGRGANALADYTAHKTITLPRGPSRALGIAGSGTGGLSTRAVGFYLGEETHILSASEIPTITSGLSSGSGTATVTTANFVASNAGDSTPLSAQGGGVVGGVSASGLVVSHLTSTGTVTLTSVSTFSTNTGGAAHNNIQPTVFVNVMIKL